MSERKRISNSSFLFFFILIVGLTSCYEPREGCLDVAATNFDFSGDEACGDCCTFPELRLQFQHKVVIDDTTSFNLVYLDSVYTVDGTNYFRIEDIQFYVSNFRLVRNNGNEVSVIDTLTIDAFDTNGNTEMITIEDNFALVNRNTFSDYDLGTYNESGSFAGLSFNMGINAEANKADPASLPDGHPLAPQSTSMYFSQDSGYVFTRIALLRDTTAADTVATVLEIGFIENLREVFLPNSSCLFGGFNLEDGFNVTFTIEIDYLRWFEGINVKTDSEEQLIKTIVENIADSFCLVEIEQSTN